MPEQFNASNIALLFVALIGSWLLVNALVDLSGRRVWGWLGRFWNRADEHRVADLALDSTPRDQVTGIG
jgi:hypothetical protein